MSDREKYRRFIDYMNLNPGWKFTKSEHMMPMITSFLTPEEADFLTGFPVVNTSLEEIAEMRGTSVAELRPKVKALCKKGQIYEAIKEDSIQYRLWTNIEMFFRVPFWAGTDDESKKTLGYNVSRYYDDGWWDQHKHFSPIEIRPLPINETVEAGTKFLPYDDVLKVIDSYEYCSVSACICRERYRQDTKSVDSPFPLETCLHFDELGRYCVENGHGREITKEETFQILKKAADAGLVHGVANHVENPTTI